jgi:hypothetical protein
MARRCAGLERAGRKPASINGRVSVAAQQTVKGRIRRIFAVDKNLHAVQEEREHGVSLRG